MTSLAYRTPTPAERQWLEALLTPRFPGRDELLEQVRHSLVREFDHNGSLEFDVHTTVKADSVKYAVPTEAEYEDAEKAAQEYEQTLRTRFKLSDGQLPRFDVLLLGMGDEGHTLSLFPGTKALHDNGRLVMSNWIGKLFTERVTITAPVANNSALAIFMVTKADKALALKGVLEGPYEPEQLPSQLIQPNNGRLLWLVDTAAASKLSTGIRG